MRDSSGQLCVLFSYGQSVVPLPAIGVQGGLLVSQGIKRELRLDASEDFLLVPQLLIGLAVYAFPAVLCPSEPMSPDEGKAIRTSSRCEVLMITSVTDDRLTAFPIGQSSSSEEIRAELLAAEGGLLAIVIPKPDTLPLTFDWRSVASESPILLAEFNSPPSSDEGGADLSHAGDVLLVPPLPSLDPEMNVGAFFDHLCISSLPGGLPPGGRGAGTTMYSLGGR